jgi:hypothetical protein
MNWVLLIVVCGLTLILGAIVFLYRRHKKDNFSEVRIDLRTAVRITSFDGWVALELELINRSDVNLWIEEAKLVITDLEANYQTAPATGQQIHKIRQAVIPDECRSISLAGSLYDAAGRPQGPYSFLLWGTVHYRIDEDWAQANIRPYRIEMAALSVVRVQRIRGNATPTKVHDHQEITSGSATQVHSAKETPKVKSVGP